MLEVLPDARQALLRPAADARQFRLRKRYAGGLQRLVTLTLKPWPCARTVELAQ